MIALPKPWGRNMEMQSFILPANGKATPDSIKRKRKMAEAMMQSGMDTSPAGHWTQGAARMAQALVGGLSQRKAGQEEAAGQQSARDAMTKALMGGDKAAMLEAMQNPWMDNASLGLVGDAWQRANAPPELKDLGEGQFYQYDPQNPQGGQVFTPQGYNPNIAPPKLMEVDGRLYNPATGEWLTPPPKPQSPDARAKLGLSPQYGVDAQGNPVLLQLGENGEAVQTEMPEGVTLSKEPIKLDAGTHYVLLDPITRQPVGQIPKDLAGAESQKAMGKSSGEIQFELPKAEMAVEADLAKIDEVINHPGLAGGTGTWQGSQIGSSIMGLVSNDVADFRQRVEQLKGGSFLQAYQSLKGGGAIANAEGTKAEMAIARLNTAVSEKDFKQALEDYKSAIRRGLAAMRAQTGQTVLPAAGGSDPEIDELVKQYGG